MTGLLQSTSIPASSFVCILCSTLESFCHWTLVLQSLEKTRTKFFSNKMFHVTPHPFNGVAPSWEIPPKMLSLYRIFGMARFLDDCLNSCICIYLINCEKSSAFPLFFIKKCELAPDGAILQNLPTAVIAKLNKF